MIRRRLSNDLSENRTFSETAVGGFVTMNNANVESITSSSDRRIKTNIESANTTVLLAHINALRVCHYNYTEHYLRHAQKLQSENLGFIAQEVEEVIPNAVNTIANKVLQTTVVNHTSDTLSHVILETLENFKSVNKQLIFTELVGAVQELSRLVTAGAARQEQLEVTHRQSLVLLQQTVLRLEEVHTQLETTQNELRVVRQEMTTERETTDEV